MSLRYQIIENEIIQCAKDFFTKKKYAVNALVFDGLMIRKTKELSDELLDELNDHVFNMTGYEVEFIIKPMNEGYAIPEDELEENDNNSVEEKQNDDDQKETEISGFKFEENMLGVSLSSTDMAKYIKYHNGTNFLWKNKQIYCYNDKYWEQNDLLMRQYIGNEFCTFLLEQYISHYVKRKKDDKMDILQILKLKDSKFKTDVLKRTEETLTNNDIKFDNNPYIFCFCNAVYELATGKFRSHQYSDFTLTTTCYDWREPTKDEITTVNLLLEVILPNPDERDIY